MLEAENIMKRIEKNAINLLSIRFKIMNEILSYHFEISFLIFAKILLFQVTILLYENS